MTARPILLMLVMALAACAQTGPTAVTLDEALASAPLRTGPWEGRLSLKLQAFGPDAARGVSMAFVLQGSADRGQLDLSTPMGTQMASVHWGSGQATLTTSEGTRRFASLDELTLHLLGESLPITALMSWLQGRPDPGLPFQPAASRPPGTGQPAIFDQAGWRIDLSEWRAGHLSAERAPAGGQRGATLKVRLDA